MLPDQRRRGMNAMEIEGLCFIFLVVFSLSHIIIRLCVTICYARVCLYMSVCLSVCLSPSLCVVPSWEGRREWGIPRLRD